MQRSLLFQLQKKIETILANRRGGKSISAAIMAHCRRELFHEAWRILLEDEEFLKAYINGIVITCSDGITRRIFPRIFTYSADYPEKLVLLYYLHYYTLLTDTRVLIATIRDMGNLPCPRCLIPKGDISRLGLPTDIKIRERKRRTDSLQYRNKVEGARDIIYKQGFTVNSEAVERILKPESLVPTRVRL